MRRIICGIEFEGNVVPDAWDVRKFEVNGHVEISARQVVAWTEIGPVGSELPDGYQWDSWDDQKKAERDALDAAERKEKALKQSAKRAQTTCRRVIKAEGFDELLTLTYRENQSDRALCKEHFEKWYRRMKKALGGFRFCASFEVQERGAMHVHVATHRLPVHGDYKGVKIEAWKLGTRIWRDIVGADNGMCFVGGKTRWGHKRQRMSLGKMAAYVSKYIMKDYADSPEEKNRYSRSNGTVIPKPVLVRLTGCTLADLISVAFECPDGDVIVSHRIGRWKDSYWLCTEPGAA